MKKEITIIVKKNIPNIGEQGTIRKVRLGYVMNYLIPKDLAEVATPGKLKHANMLRDIKLKEAENIKIKADQTKINLEKITKISIKKKVGDEQQIFGSVNEKDILNYIFNATGEKLEKKQIILPVIKEIGIYLITIKIIESINVELKLQILPDNI